MILRVLAPAKINLTLDIVGKRQDGYHLLRSVMQAITLFDELELSQKEYGIGLSCDTASIQNDNIAVKAAMAFFARTGLPGGVDIKLIKNIPMGAGLGGGSSDAAAVLVGLNAMYGARMSLCDIAALGESLGADVPFCIYGGTALAEGIGEQLTPLPDIAEFSCVLIKPEFSVSTRDAYAAIDRGTLSMRPKLDSVLSAISQGLLVPVASGLGNIFEEAVEPAQYAQITQAKAELMRLGALGAAMSGSGSVVFGLFGPHSDAARTALSSLRTMGYQSFFAEPHRGGPVLSVLEG